MTEIAGRVAELAALDQVLDGAAHGAAPLVLLRGEPGIGKTRLLNELAHKARHHLVLIGRASEFERELPLGVFVDALDPYLSSIDPVTLHALGSERLDDLAAVFPALKSLGRGSGAALQEERFRTVYAIRALLEHLAAHQPIVLALDDIHWADPASLETITHLARRRVGARVILALAMRPAHTPPRIARELSTMADALLPLEPLTRAEAGPLLPGTDADEIYRESGGNPFYLTELTRLANTGRPARGADLPERVAFAIADEVESLSLSAQLVAKTAAVLAERFDPRGLSAASGLPEPEVLQAIDELTGRDLIRPTETPSEFRFRHPLVRSAVYETAEPGWRLATHTRIAEWLTAQGAPPNVIAPHVERSASPGDKAAIALLKSAGAATHVRAPAIAAHWYEAALRLQPDDPELLMALAQSLGAVGQFTESLRRAEQVLRLIPGETGPGWVQVMVFCASIENLVGKHAQGIERLRKALHAVPGDDQANAAVLQLELAVGAMYSGQWQEMVDFAQAALRSAQAVGDTALSAAATAAVAFGANNAGEWKTAEPFLDESAKLFDALDDGAVAGGMAVPYYLGWAELIGERYPDAIRHLERGLAVSRQTGAGYLYVPMTVGLSWAFAETGRLAEAVELTQNAVDSARLADNPLGLTLALGALGIWTMQSGDVTAALPMCAEAAEQGRLIGAFSVGFLATYWLAATLLEAGEPARAVELLAQQDFPAGKVAISCYEILARAELALGDSVAAQRWANHAMAAADKFDTPLSRASALRANAALLLANGDPAAAEPALRAAELAGSAGNPIQAARARMLAAQALAQTDRGRAIAELSTAEATLAACGARRWRDEAALALRSLGQRAPARHTPTSDAPFGLSARERDVAALLAEGKTNRQIGEQLFIGVRTVETHVARILTKIGVESRTAAAAALTRANQASSSP